MRGAHHAPRYSFFATKLSVAKSPTLRENLISSPAFTPVYVIGTEFPWN